MQLKTISSEFVRITTNGRRIGNDLSQVLEVVGSNSKCIFGLQVYVRDKTQLMVGGSFPTTTFRKRTTDTGSTGR